MLQVRLTSFVGFHLYVSLSLQFLSWLGFSNGKLVLDKSMWKYLLNIRLYQYLLGLWSFFGQFISQWFFQGQHLCVQEKTSKPVFQTAIGHPLYHFLWFDHSVIVVTVCCSDLCHHAEEWCRTTHGQLLLLGQLH